MIAAAWLEQTLARRGLLLAGEATADAPLTGATQDSRLVRAGDLFVALPGAKTDGHRFVAEAFERGARAALVSDRQLYDSLRESGAGQGLLFLVQDTLVALQELAARHLARVAPRVLAVTGSNGKTGTKAACHRFCATLGASFASAGNYNNLIGLPLTLLSLAPETRYAVLEMGCSSFGEIARLCELFPPEIGIITNIGAAHLELLGDLDGVARAKGELPAALPAEGLLILPGEDAYAPVLAARSAAPVRRFGFGDQCDARVEDLGPAGLGARRARLEEQTLTLPFSYRHGLLSLAAAWTAARHLGATPSALAAVSAELAPPRDRGGLYRLGDWWIMDDSYNANPQSTAAALAWLGEVKDTVRGRRWAVLGDMLELGAAGPGLHRELGELAAGLDLDGLLATGPLAAEYVAGARAAGMASAAHFATSESLARDLSRRLGAEDLVLIKGSRGAAMERVIAALAAETGARREERA